MNCVQSVLFYLSRGLGVQGIRRSNGCCLQEKGVQGIGGVLKGCGGGACSDIGIKVPVRMMRRPRNVCAGNPPSVVQLFLKSAMNSGRRRSSDLLRDVRLRAVRRCSASGAG